LDILLVVFVALTAIAVMTQAGVLVAIYMVSKRHSEQMERFMNETREMMAPIKTITENLRTASVNIVEIGIAARDQFRRVEGMVNDTSEVLQNQLARLDSATRDVVERVNGTAQVLQESVIRPVREVAAIAKGIGRGLEALFLRRPRPTVDQAHQDEELFI
jgi:flagellar basal body-associated protein FliL